MTSRAPAVDPGPDPGLFGPDSMSWRVHADPAMALGGLRALLLQTLHPVALAGVLQHSDFRADPWGRLQRTGAFIGTVTFGTTEQAGAAAARVRRIHHGLGGVDPVTGRHYRVDDPDLLLWVHCCEVDSFLATYRRSGAPLGAGEADRYVAEQRRAAALVGLHPEEVPGDTDELAAYFAEMRPQLRGGAAARDVARFVLLPPMPGWVGLLTPARPAWLALTAAAVGLLPRWARRLYGLPGLVTTDVSASAGARLLRTGLAAVPPTLREGPHLVAARERLGLAG